MRVFKTMDEMMDCFVKYVSTDMLLDVLGAPGGRGRNSNYYWRWSGYVGTEQVKELFPDIDVKLREPTTLPSGTKVSAYNDLDKVYAYQLEKWYDVDFTEAHKQVWERFEAKLKEAEELFRN